MILVFGSLAVADVYIRQKSHTDSIAVMGREQPARDDVIEMWLGDDRMAVEMPQMKIVIDLGKNVMHWVNHQNKTFVEMALPLDMEKYFPAQMMQMMGNVSVTVTPTGEKKQIGEWACEAYDVVMNIMMMDVNQRVWASKDVPFDWKEYAEKMMPMLNQAMMRLGEDSVKEMMKIEGFQIRTETTMNVMGSDMNSWTEVEEITNKPAPEGAYGVPDGYTQKEKLDMMDIQR
jgi:hypothetical protein